MYCNSGSRVADGVEKGESRPFSEATEKVRARADETQTEALVWVMERK